VTGVPGDRQGAGAGVRYYEGVATPIGPESCLVGREVAMLSYAPHSGIVMLGLPHHVT
jgi:hypothetical protein